MSLYSFFGCMFVAYGPLLSIFFLYISRDAQLVLLMVCSVLMQELFRWALFKLLKQTPTFTSSFCVLVSGFGFGLTSALVTYISTLVQTIGPGVIMCPSCPNATLFFVSAITTTLASLQHITWMMIAFEAYLNLPSISGILQGVWVLASHFGVSYAMILNTSESVSLGCVYSIIVQLVILAISTTLVVLNLKKHYGAAVFSRTHR
ncbi:Aph-1 protein-domain-containing protein [Umbelopsis sp. PMI_123]|nr:Aph-1 protein-domain-containing protein [Umbelopsis sp. PMI_123]